MIGYQRKRTLSCGSWLVLHIMETPTTSGQPHHYSSQDTPKNSGEGIY